MEQYSKLNEDNKSLTQFLNALLVVRGGLQPAAKKYLEQCEPFVIDLHPGRGPHQHHQA